MIKKDRAWETEIEEVTTTFLNHFNVLFSFNHTNLQDDLFLTLQGEVSKSLKALLDRPFAKEGILASFFSIHPLKTPNFD